MQLGEPQLFLCVHRNCVLLSDVLRDAKALTSLLVEVYPTHQWNMERLLRDAGPIKSSQRQLYNVVRELLPAEGKNVFYHLTRM